MELLKNLEGLSADEQMTAVVELQKAAMKTLEEQKQASIGKSAELVIQGLKKIKSDFEAKFDSLNYDIQTKVASLKDGEQGLQGPKGDQGERGLDGSNGRDGRDGKDGKDGLDGVDGVGVRDAKIDFDGSLVISLTDGREINCGEVVSVDVAKQIQKVTHNIQTGAGGDSQTVLDAIAAIQATIATYGTMATQNKTSVDIEGGTIDNTTIGATTPSTGVFTTLTATGQTSLGGVTDVESFRVSATSGTAGNNNYLWALGSASSPSLYTWGTSTNVPMLFRTRGSGQYEFATGSSSGTIQARIAHTASAVNYVQVTGAATGSAPSVISAGSDSSSNLAFSSKGTGSLYFYSNSANANSRHLDITHNGSVVNRFQLTGANAGSGVVLGVNGGDTNISQVFQSKGTGAIDLAAGSRGVNISNGGTVTAITGTAFGSNYTSAPSVVISAPTTAGGVQATATIPIQVGTVTISSGGTGYTVNDVLTVVGGTFTTVCQLTVSAVSGGVITAVTTGGTARGNYTVAPSNPASVTGGTGSGATFTLNFAVANNTTFTITNAGSGYVEQPTVTFSGGGGSGAAAYATVGSATVIRGLGGSGSSAQSISFATPAGESFRVATSTTGGSSANYLQAASGATGNGVWFSSQGSDSNVWMTLATKGTGNFQFLTNLGQEQFRVSHTASAVNYVQVTGAATGGLPVISAQGSDTNIAMYVTSKGNGTIRFATNNSAQTQLRVSHTTSAVNFVDVTGSAAGASPIISVAGNDTNIDLTLTPKGTGNVRFGTYTGTALSIAGYIEIKDSGGTVRKLAVVA